MTPKCFSCIFCLVLTTQPKKNKNQRKDHIPQKATLLISQHQVNICTSYQCEKQKPWKTVKVHYHIIEMLSWNSVQTEYCGHKIAKPNPCAAVNRGRENVHLWSNFVLLIGCSSENSCGAYKLTTIRLVMSGYSYFTVQTKIE